MAAYSKFADIYDTLIYEDINYKEWSSKILEVCKTNNIVMEDYLDLGCGTGNMAINIVPFFKSSWCVDLSFEMLVEAEQKFRRNKCNAKFVCQDMTDLNLNHKFNLITCTLDCTNYLVEDGELLKFFSSVSNSLKEDGIFIFDINSQYKLLNVIGENTFTYNSEDIVYIWENRIENNLIQMDITFFVKEDDIYHRFDELHTERMYTEMEIEESLCNSNLEVIKKSDSYSDKDVINNTERITYIVKKKIR